MARAARATPRRAISTRGSWSSARRCARRRRRAAWSCPLAAHCAARADRPPGRAARRRRAQEASASCRCSRARCVWIERRRRDRARAAPRRRACSAGCGSCRERATASRARSALPSMHEPVAYHDQTLTHRRLRVAVVSRQRAAAACRRRRIRATTPSTRVGIADARHARRRRRDHRDPAKYEDTPWSSIPRRSPSSPRATTKILEGIGAPRLRHQRRELRRHRGARGERASTSSSTTRSRSSPRSTALLAKTFPAKYTEMVISKHNTAFGVCPHHLLPVIYRISMAYIPTEKVLGLSKLSRLARLIARGPRLQEDLTHELADILHEQLAEPGLRGLHRGPPHVHGGARRRRARGAARDERRARRVPRAGDARGVHQARRRAATTVL